MPLNETVERIDNKKDVQKTTIQYCSIELYSVSDSYDCESILLQIKKDSLQNKSAYVIAYHDQDIYSENTFDSYKRLVGVKGQPKKPHYHVLIRLPYRMERSDVALKYGINERWILKLKKEADFDRMIWYVSHEQYDTAIKHHYDYHSFDTNIFEYVEYIMNVNRNRISNNIHIITKFLEFANDYDDRKISYQVMYKYLFDVGYTMHDIKDSYQQLKDILNEHNIEILSPGKTQHIIDKKLMEQNINDHRSLASAEKLVDVFGATTIENDEGKKYVLTNARVKERKNKK